MNWSKILRYILLAFAISWSVALVLKLADIPYGGIRATLMIGAFYMTGPALAVFILQKWIYKEGFKAYGWTYSSQTTRSLGRVLLLFLLLFATTLLIILFLGNSGLVPEFGRIDMTDEGFRSRLIQIVFSKTGLTNFKMPKLPAVPLFAVLLLQGALTGAIVNLPFTFGEEFGWRGLLFAETRKMGFVGSSIFIGIVWGIWHAPLILMGHNYPHHPYGGILMMCLFTTSLCPLFAYVRIKSQSIIGPGMLHGMINATNNMFILYVADPDELYSSMAGWAGIAAGFLIAAGIILGDKKFVAAFSGEK
jgi:uncharacterized protein